MIPKVIHKVILVDGGKLPSLPDGMKSAIETFYRMNPGYRVKLYSGQDCVEYIKTHFDDEILDAYNKLKPYSFKCDFMRHLILYNEGGWYTDMRMVCLQPLDVLNDLNMEHYTCVDCPPNETCMCTGFIGSVEKHPISKKMIDLLMWNINQEHYGLDCLYPTGPGAYMNASIDYIRKYPNRVCVGRHTIEDGEHFIRYHKLRIIKVKYNNAKGADNTDMEGTNDYGEMWRNRDVYLNNERT